jgi:hypothetical protein
MPHRAFFIGCLLFVSVGLAGCNPFRTARYPCLSHEPGLRGEVMRGPDGKFLYYNGQCWTARPMPPRDTPF